MFLSSPFGFGGGGGVSLNGVPSYIFGTAVDNNPPYRDVYAYVTLNPDGTGSATFTQQTGVEDVPFEWFPPTIGIGVYHWVRFTDAGGPSGLNYGVEPGPELYQLNLSRSCGLFVKGGTQGYRWTDLKIELFADPLGEMAVDSKKMEIAVEFAY